MRNRRMNRSNRCNPYDPFFVGEVFSFFVIVADFTVEFSSEEDCTEESFFVLDLAAGLVAGVFFAGEGV